MPSRGPRPLRRDSRVVNLVCDRALLAGFVKGSRTVTRHGAPGRRGGRGPGPALAFRWHHGLIATGLTLALALLAFSFAPRLARAPEAPATGVPAVGGGAQRLSGDGDARPPPSARGSTNPPDGSADASFASASARVEAAWGRARSPAPPAHAPRSAADARPPAVLEMFHPRAGTPASWPPAARPEDGGRRGGSRPGIEAPLSQVDALWTRDASSGGPSSARWRGRSTGRGLGAKGPVRPGLRGAGPRRRGEPVPASGGPRPDGVPGPRTRMALFALSPGARPRITSEGERP